MERNIRTPSVTVVIPTINEEKNLSHVIPLIPTWVTEIIIVDGLSTDNTTAEAKRLKSDIKVILVNNPGKGVALKAGFEASHGDIIVMLDGDGSTNPREIISFVEALKQGADFVKGSRFIVGGGSADMTMLRRVGNLFFIKITNILFSVDFTDLCYGYMAFWRDILDDLHVHDVGFEIETALCIAAVSGRLKISEIPSFEKQRLHGISKLHPFRDGLVILKVVLRDWSRKVGML